MNNTHATTLSPFAVFRNRDFSLLWTSQLVSTIGSALTSLAASILVFRLTGSALSVGLMLVATAAPSVFIGLIAGVYVDRVDRKRIMVVADIIRAILVISIPFIIKNNIIWLYVLVALTSAFEQFFNPAIESVLPEVASDQELAAANSMMAISTFGSTAIGFAASGLIASRFSIEWAFYLDGLTFFISGACILFVRVPKLVVEGKTNVQTVARNLKAGVRFLLETPVLRSLLIVSVPTLISLGLWNSLLLPFTLRALKATEFEFGIQEALTSVGFVVASLMMARLSDRLREGQWITIGYLGMGIVGVLVARSESVLVATALLMVAGFMNAPSSIARRLLIQRNTKRQVRGRVFSAFKVTANMLFLIGMAAVGLADVIDVRIMFLISAGLLLVAGLLALVMPGLGQPAAEWRRAMSLLRAAPAATGLSAGRPAMPADMDLLVGHLPALVGLSPSDRTTFLSRARVIEAPEGTAILRHGEVGDTAYFVLSGQAVAGIAAEGEEYRSLSNMNPGDFFGEIAALTGSPRTANVVAAKPATLLQVPAEALRGLMAIPQLSHLFLTTMTERLSRTHKSDLPRFAGLDQESLRDLRTPQADLEAQDQVPVVSDQ